MRFHTALIGVLIFAAGSWADDPKAAVYQDKTATEWAEGLSSRAASERFRAVFALRSMRAQAKPATESLAKALEDKDEWIRQAAADALERIGPDAKIAVNQLRRALKDEQVMVRWRAIHALGAIGPDAKEAVSELSDLLDAEEEYVRSSAIVALGRIGTEAKSSVSKLQKHLKDDKPWIRVYAANALWRVARHEDVVPFLIEELNRLDSILAGTGIRELFQELGKEAEKSIPGLKKALKSDRESTRAAAAELIGVSGAEAKSVVPALTESLSDSSAWVIYQAAESLGRYRKQAAEAIPALQKVYKQTDVEYLRIRLLQTLWLAEKDQKHIVALIEYFDSKSDASNHSRAFQRLVELGADAVPDLIKALKDKRTSVAYSAEHALWMIGPRVKVSLNALMEMLRDSKALVRKRAATIIGQVGPEAQAALAELLNADERDVEVRRAGLTAAVKIAGNSPDVLRALKEAEKTEQLLSSVGQLLVDIGEIELAVPVLIDAIKKDSSTLGKERAAESLGMLGPKAKDAVSVLLEASKTDANYFVSAAEALWRIDRNPEAIKALIDGLWHKNRFVCEKCAVTLGKIAPDDAKVVSELTKLLKSEHGIVRVSACEALGMLGEKAQKAVPELLRIRKDEADTWLSEHRINRALLQIDPHSAKQAGVKFPFS